MAATAGSAIFTGKSGMTYSKDIYLSDTVNTPINWDAGVGAAATSPAAWRCPEDVLLTDVAIVTGAAQTKLQVTRNGVPNGNALRHTLHLNTLNNRPNLRIPFNAGDDIGAIQLA